MPQGTGENGKDPSHLGAPIWDRRDWWGEQRPPLCTVRWGRGEKLACAESLGDDRRPGAFPNPKCKTQAHLRLQTKPHTTHTRSHHRAADCPRGGKTQSLPSAHFTSFTLRKCEWAKRPCGWSRNVRAGLRPDKRNILRCCKLIPEAAFGSSTGRCGTLRQLTRTARPAFALTSFSEPSAGGQAPPPGPALH